MTRYFFSLGQTLPVTLPVKLHPNLIEQQHKFKPPDRPVFTIESIMKLFLLLTLLVSAEGQFHRKLPTRCKTAEEVATCFASAGNGDEIETAPGTLSSWDGILSWAQLSLRYKYASIACSADGGACVWQGATGKTVVYIRDNGGTSTLSHLVVKDGDTPSGYDGGGLFVRNSNVVLILVAFIDNAASSNGGAIYVTSTGSSSVTLHGCSFSGNTASYQGPDVYNSRETVAIGGCPEGKSIRPFVPPPSFKTTNPPPPPSSLRRFCSNPRFRPEQLEQQL